MYVACYVLLTQTHGLSTTGQRDRLVERHRQWVNLYNANLDAAPALREPVSSLRRQLQVWERALDSDSAKGVSSERQARAWLVRIGFFLPRNHIKANTQSLRHRRARRLRHYNRPVMKECHTIQRHHWTHMCPKAATLLAQVSISIHCRRCRVQHDAIDAKTV